MYSGHFPKGNKMLFFLFSTRRECKNELFYFTLEISIYFVEALTSVYVYALIYML